VHEYGLTIISSSKVLILFGGIYYIFAKLGHFSRNLLHAHKNHHPADKILGYFNLNEVLQVLNFVQAPLQMNLSRTYSLEYNKCIDYFSLYQS
jgi:hypothetical protein